MNIIKQLFAVLLLSCVTMVSAQDFEVNGITYSITDTAAKTVSVIKNYSNENVGDIVIPATVTYNGNTYTVTSIGKEAFANCSDITSISLPDCITSIEEKAFYKTNLKSFKIPKKLQHIGYLAFYILTLEELHISDLSSWCQIDYTITNMSNYYACSPLYYAKKLYLNGDLLTDIIIPNDVTQIKSLTFLGGREIKSVIIHPNITHIGDYAFCNCSKLTSIEIPSSITEIGRSAFSNCTELQNATINNSVIGYAQFSGCTKLTDIKIPNGVTKIEDFTFSNCKSLRNVTIPSSITEIGIRAFQNCNNLISIRSFIPAENLFELDTRYGCAVFDGANTNTCILYVPHNALDTYKTTNGWSSFKNIEELKYRITYIVNGEVYTTRDLTYGAEIPVDIKEGYTFVCDDLPSSMPAEDITISGSFTVNNYTVTYIVDGEVYKTVSVAYGTDVVLIDEPTKEGHTFSGWSEAPTTMPAEDITISGSFTVNNYTVTYIVDGEVYKTVGVAYGTDVVLIDEPTKEGHTFSGWSEAPSSMPAEDITVSGSFTVNNYTVTYIVDGEVYKTDSVVYGADVVLIDEPTKEGCTFSGWSEAPATMPAEDITISGSFSVNSYAVTYIVDGEVYKTVNVVYGADVVLIDEPTKEGYTFGGWSEAPATMPAEDIVISGSFLVNSYNVTFTVDGEVYQSMSVEYGTVIPTVETPTKVGHTFSGWSEIPSTMPAVDITISGSFSANSYAVTYIVDGEVYKTVNVVYGADVVLIDEPTKEGYTFSGWSEAPATMPAEDIVISGSFLVNSYNVTFTVDGEVYQSMSVEYGTVIPTVETPTKEGRKFSGWSEIPSTMPAKNVNIEGGFCYTIIFMLDGKYYCSSEIYYGTVIKAPAEPPHREGHTFVEWGNLPETMPARDMTIHAIYSVNKYQLIFIIDGEVYETLYIEYGSKIEYPQIEGYVITWETDDLPETMPAENLIIIGTSTLDTAIKGIHEVHSDYIIYTLDGHRVLDIENLRSGFYIINGKKVFVK